MSLDPYPHINHSPEDYERQLGEKVAQTQAEFADFGITDIDVFCSFPSHYRMRAEFKIWQQAGQCYYAMFHPDHPKKPLKLDLFPVGSKTINQLMPKLLTAINQSELLRKKLFQCEFLSSTLGECVVTLIYHKLLDDAWQEEALRLKAQLNIDIIGRSKKQKLILNRDWVSERFHVAGEYFTYEHVEASFTQPNAGICEAMLNWAVEQAAEHKNPGSPARTNSGDLLELYCGNGNFTLPLSRHFSRVLATEISKSSVNSAKRNMARNQVENIDFARLSSEELTQALEGERTFKRLEHLDLAAFNFSTVLVDPPRAGLDDGTRNLIQRFERIIYISCNPDTLQRDLQTLCLTHRVTKAALFDQFPFTLHRECGVILERKG